MLQNLADDDAKKSGRSRNPQANPHDFSQPQEPTVGEEIIKSTQGLVTTVLGTMVLLCTGFSDGGETVDGLSAAGL